MQINHKKIKVARILKDLSLEEPAIALNIDTIAYWRIETEKSQLKANILIKLMKIYQQPLEFFLDREVFASSIEQKSKELFHFLRRIDLLEHDYFLLLYSVAAEINRKS